MVAPTRVEEDVCVDVNKRRKEKPESTCRAKKQRRGGSHPQKAEIFFFSSLLYLGILSFIFMRSDTTAHII